MSDDRLLAAPEAAELLNVPVSWMREQTRAGRVPCVRFPGSRIVRYRRDDLVAWTASLVEGGGPGWRCYRPSLAAAGRAAGLTRDSSSDPDGGGEQP